MARGGPSDSQIRFYPVGFCNIGLRKKADHFFRSINVKLKLGIGSHKNQAIRFRASDFGKVANRNRLLVRNRMRRWCWGHLFVCLCDSAVRFLDSEFQANVDYCSAMSGAAKRRAECTSLSPELKASKLALPESSLVANRRAAACT